MDDYFMRRGHVPAFGSWDCCEDNNDLPFTQCFESARQAGLLHYAYSSDDHEDRDLYVAGDLYQNDVVTPAMIVVPRRKARGCHAHMKKEGKKKQNWETVVKEPPSPPPSPPPRRPIPKPVDEDLYRISPDLLFSKPKKKRMLCLFSSCLLPTCAL